MIGLVIVDGIKWLPEIFGTMPMPEFVKNEVLPGVTARGGNISHAIELGWLKAWSELIQPLLDIDLNVDETDCINLDLGHTGEVLLIRDELAGPAVAKEKGLSFKNYRNCCNFGMA